MRNSIEFFLNNHLGWALSPHNFTLTLSLSRVHCYPPIPPWLLLFCPIFQAQNSLLVFLWYLFNCILPPTPTALYIDHSSFSCCISLHLHASRQLLLHIFLKYSPEINPCFWFSYILVLLELYPSHSTNITTSHLVIHPLCSNAVLLRGILHIPLYSCAFLHKECTSFSSCYTFCGVATCATTFSYLLFSTSIFGHSHL